MNKIYVKRGDKNTQVGDKIDEIEVTFRCKGGPIGEVGTFFGKVVSKILFAKVYTQFVKKEKLKKLKKLLNWKNQTLMRLCYYFQMKILIQMILMIYK